MLRDGAPSDIHFIEERIVLWFCSENKKKYLTYTGIIMCMRPANEILCYNVASSFIGGLIQKWSLYTVLSYFLSIKIIEMLSHLSWLSLYHEKTVPDKFGYQKN